MEPFTLRDVVTLAIASVGAVLGVINTWKGLDKDRPKLRLLPTRAVMLGPGVQEPPRLCIEVTNLSTFPLTVTEVGLLFRGTSSRGALLEHMLDGSKLPRRLEPRTSVSVYAYPTALDGLPYPVKCAYARTDCGLQFTATSPALAQLTAKVR